MRKRKRLVVLFGPSCVGKGPLRKALLCYYPGLKYAELTLCNSRRPRLKKDTGLYEVHGIDYYFLPRSMFAQLDRDRFIVGEVRSDIQAIDMEQVRELLRDNDLVLVEVFHTLGRSLMEWVNRQSDLEFNIRIVALVPLSDQEIQEAARVAGKEPEQIVYETMEKKLEKRGEDTPAKIKERASSAFAEIKSATCATDLIVNHAGEDDREQWSDPLGPEAQRVLGEFVAILNCEDSEDERKKMPSISPAHGASEPTRPYLIMWHDYVDGVSHSKVIQVLNGKNPEFEAYDFLMNNVGEHNYLLEDLEEIKEGKVVHEF